MNYLDIKGKNLYKRENFDELFKKTNFFSTNIMIHILKLFNININYVILGSKILIILLK